MPSSHHSALVRVSPRTLGRGNPIERNATPGHIEHTDRKTPGVRIAATRPEWVSDAAQDGP